MKTELFLLAAAVIVSGCLGTTDPGTSEPMNETSEPTSLPDRDSNTVYLTESGFSPSTVTVEQGETVTWINNASTPMEVASNRHPTHTNYAGTTRNSHCQNGDQTSAAFDQCQEGDRFSFTFEKTGNWGYHNHENAGQAGTIIVE